MLLGIDVSKHQGRVDLAAARATSDMRFAVLKCSEGVGYEDPSFRANWDELLAMDPASNPEDKAMVRGVYHYARPDTGAAGAPDGEAEARSFSSILSRAGGYGGGCLPPALDWEEYPRKTVAHNLEWIAAFVHVVEQEIGRSPMIYTGRNVWRYTTGDSDAFKHLPLWQAEYSRRAYVNPSSSPTPIPKNSGAQRWPWTLWQWSAGGSYAHYKYLVGEIDGVAGGVADVNRFDGSWQDLVGLTGLKVAQPTSVPAVTPPVVSPSVMAVVDLAWYDAARTEPIVAIVQGLLLAHGYGPQGLVGSDGLPDGRAGDRTKAALRRFKREHGLAPEGRDGDTVTDPLTWWMLLSP